jgi:hypothetical protein
MEPFTSDSPAPAQPIADDHSLELQLAFNPKTGEMVYRPIVPHGVVWKVYVQFAMAPTIQCTEVQVLLDGERWFTTGWTETFVVERLGVSCQFQQFTEKAVTVRISNQSTSAAPITLQLVPMFTDGQRVWSGKDPQIVLPPEKMGGDATACEDA